MVLVPAQARKGQRGRVFAQEDMTVRERGFRAFRIRRAGKEKSASKKKRSASGAERGWSCADYCDTLNVIVKGVFELVIAVPPVGAPVVALIVTT